MSDNTGAGAADDTVDAFKKAVKKGNEVQLDFIKYFSSVQHDAMQNFFSMLQGMTQYNAMFKTTVQTGGRISIPDAERRALNIEEGDLVQVILIPIERGRKSPNETK
jgi:AbrB family looped-hinge helix DNA binding protein